MNRNSRSPQKKVKSSVVGHRCVPSTLPPPCSRLNVIHIQQTHTLQINDSSHTYLCRPCLEQHITVKLSTSTNITVQVPKSNRRLSRTKPHTLPSFHALTRIHSYFHLPADGEIFSELYHAFQPSYFPNRKLLFTRPSRTVNKIHTQMHQTSPTVDLTWQSQCFLHCIYLSLL
jgi:hypothetical protein